MKISFLNRKARRAALSQNISDLRREYYERAKSEGHYGCVGGVSEYLTSMEIYLDIGRDRNKLPADWVESSIRPRCEEFFSLGAPFRASNLELA